MKDADLTSYRSNAAVYGLALLVVIYIGKIQELIPDFDNYSIGKIVVAASVLLYLMAPKTNRHSLFDYPQVKYVLGILLLATITSPFSVWPGGSFSYITQVYMKTLFFFFLLITIVSNAAEINKIAWGAVFAVSFLSIAVLLGDQEGRVYATNTYDRNDLAFVMVTFLPIVYYMMKSKTGVVKIILSAVMVLMLVSVLVSASRGGFVGLVVVGVAIFLKHGKSLKQAVLPLIVTVVVFNLFASAAYWERMSTIMNLQQDYNMTAVVGRIEVWKHGLSMMASHPLFGVGMSAFDVAEGHMHSGAGKWSAAHNSFIQIGGELGIIALVLFVKLLTSSIKSLRECRLSDKSGVLPSWLLDGTEVAFYGYITTGFFLSQAYSAVLFLLIGLAILARKVLDSHSQDQEAVLAGNESLRNLRE